MKNIASKFQLDNIFLQDRILAVLFQMFENFIPQEFCSLFFLLVIYFYRFQLSL